MSELTFCDFSIARPDSESPGDYVVRFGSELILLALLFTFCVLVWKEERRKLKECHYNAVKAYY